MTHWDGDVRPLAQRLKEPVYTSGPTSRWEGRAPSMAGPVEEYADTQPDVDLPQDVERVPAGPWKEARQSAFDAMEDAGHPTESIETLNHILVDWGSRGYTGKTIAPIWDAAQELTGGLLPEDGSRGIGRWVRDYQSHGFSIYDDIDRTQLLGDEDDLAAVIADFIRLNQETAIDLFGNSVTIYRGMKNNVFENHTSRDGQGGLVIRPLVLESYSLDNQAASAMTGSRSALIRRTVPTTSVFFIGDIAIPGYSHSQGVHEITLGSDSEPYTVPEDDWLKGDEVFDALEHFQAGVPPLLPPEDLDWAR